MKFPDEFWLLLVANLLITGTAAMWVVSRLQPAPKALPSPEPKYPMGFVPPQDA